jgi:ribosomal protein L9
LSIPPPIHYDSSSPQVGDKDQIFGSVSVKEVVEAIYQQTGRNIPEADLSVPDIKSVGTFECSGERKSDACTSMCLNIWNVLVH